MSKKNTRIVCFHLFNDFSGSPKVLRAVLQGLLDDGYDIDLYSSSTPGVLNKLNSSLGRLNFSKYKYSFSNNKLHTLLRLVKAQCKMFRYGLGYSKTDNVVFYVNTLLPVAAAIAGRIRGIKVIYHYHEDAHKKGIGYRFLARLMQMLASEIICVSEYQRKFLKRTHNVSVIPNALGQNLHRSLKPHIERAFEEKNILMLASLKGYKGVNEFINMSKSLSDFKFTLVLNEDNDVVARYLSHQEVPQNLSIYSRQNKVANFYNNASLVLNLSDKRSFVETFGLTVLEAMTAALPVIVPTVGGVAEMVEDGVNGYKIDIQDSDKIESKIKDILLNKSIYVRLSESALAKAEQYSYSQMLLSIKSLI